MRLRVYLPLIVIALLAAPAAASGAKPPKPPTVGPAKWYCGTEVYPSGDRDRWCWKGRVLKVHGSIRLRPV